jgi:hypothetical protein
LENVAILAAQEVAFLCGVFEDRGGLAEVGVYPDADFLDKPYRMLPTLEREYRCLVPEALRRAI